MQKVVIGSLRNQARCAGPLKAIEDNVYYCLGRYIENDNKKYKFDYYNVSFTDTKPNTDISVFDDADVVVLITVVEWTYHIPNFRHQYDQKKSDDKVAEIAKRLDGKSLIVISHEQADTLELFRDRTFKDVKFKNITTIHQDEMTDAFMHMRYFFIQDAPKLFHEYEKSIDFVYWGSSKTKTVGGVKSGDTRMITLTDLWKRREKDNFTTFFQGKYDKIVKDASWTNDFNKLIPQISKGHATLCFQWPGKEHIATTRYPEALACDVIPLIWQKFDVNGFLYNPIEWQRCHTVDEVVEKIKQLQDDGFRLDKLNEIRNNFLPKASSIEAEYKTFIETLERKLDSFA